MGLIPPMGTERDRENEPRPGVGSDRVLQELEAIFASPEFERAPVMRRLLGFLVRTTLDGQGDDLKAYSVAVDGLGRAPDFDAQTDSYPRVQIARLRKMLEAYYAATEPQDDVRFAIHPGSYRVHFEPRSQIDSQVEIEDSDRSSDAARPIISPDRRRRGLSSGAPFAMFAALLLFLTLGGFWLWTQSETRAAASAPVLEVEQIRVAGNREAAVLAKRVEAVLDIALHRSWIAQVTQSLGDGAPRRQPDYRLETQVNAGPGYSGRRLFLTLWDARAGKQLWSERVVLPEGDESILPAMRVPLAALIGPFGAIATDQRGRLKEEVTTYGCLLNADRYIRERDPALRKPVRTCVGEALAREPGNANILAVASFLEYDYSITRGNADAYARGAEYARRAVMANPYSAEALMADARAAIIAGECTRGRDISDRVVQLNPYSAENIGLMGFLLYECGDQRALQLLREARELDMELPTFYFAAEMMALIEIGRTEEAVRLADSIRRPGNGMSAQYEVIRTLANAAKGDVQAARRHWENVARDSGASSSTADDVLRPYFFTPGFRQQLVAYLNRSGVVGPSA